MKERSVIALRKIGPLWSTTTLTNFCESQTEFQRAKRLNETERQFTVCLALFLLSHSKLSHSFSFTSHFSPTVIQITGRRTLLFSVLSLCHFSSSSHSLFYGRSLGWQIWTVEVGGVNWSIEGEGGGGNILPLSTDWLSYSQLSSSPTFILLNCWQKRILFPLSILKQTKHRFYHCF